MALELTPEETATREGCWGWQYPQDILERGFPLWPGHPSGHCNLGYVLPWEQRTVDSHLVLRAGHGACGSQGLLEFTHKSEESGETEEAQHPGSPQFPWAVQP